MVIITLIPVKFAIWIQQKLISEQRADKNLRRIYGQLRSEFLSLTRNQLHRQNFWSISGDPFCDVPFVLLSLLMLIPLPWTLSDCSLNPSMCADNL